MPSPIVRRVGALCALSLVTIAVALLTRGPGNDQQISSADAAAAAVSVADAPLPGAVASFSSGASTAAIPGVETSPSAASGPITIAAGMVVSPTSATPTSATPTSATPTSATPRTASPNAAASATVAGSGAFSAARVETASKTRSAGTEHPIGIGTPVVPTKRSCAIEYTVAQGDYWISIAKSSSVKLADLLVANGAKVSTALYAGRIICLPTNASAPTTTVKAPTTTTKSNTPNTTAKPNATTATAARPKPSSTNKTPITVTSTTVTPTTAAPSTTAAPPANTYSRSEVEQIIRNVWPDDLEEEAVRIATRESNLIPTVRNSCCYGLFQIYFNANKSSLVSWGITSASALYDPQVNAYAAYAMYLRAGGWGPWAN